MSIKKLGWIITLASVSLFAVVMTVTQGIWLNFIFKYPTWSTQSTKALAGFVFSVIALLVLGSSLYFFAFKKINNFGFIALGLAVLLLAIALFLPLSSQHDIYSNWDLIKTAIANDPNDMNPALETAHGVYMVNIIFASITSIGAVAGTLTHFAAAK